MLSMSLKKSEARERIILWSRKRTLSEEQTMISAVGSLKGGLASEDILSAGNSENYEDVRA